MEWDTELENLAQAWADYLISNNKFEHDPKNGEQGTGENLYKASGADSENKGCEQAIQAWYVYLNECIIEKDTFINSLVKRHSKKGGHL